MRNNAQIMPLLTTDKQEIITLINLKVSLKRVLGDFENKMQEEDERYDVYFDLQENLGEGFAEPTVRKWLNTHNNEYPPLTRLVTLCRQIGASKPLRVAANYLIMVADAIDKVK